MEKRKILVCANCREDREILAHGLCAKCYRREERAAENPWAAADKHNRGALKAQKKLRKVVTSVLNAIDDGIELMDAADVAAIRAIVKPYLARIVAGLPDQGKSAGAVNSEQDLKTSVHKEISLVPSAVNSEPSFNPEVHIEVVGSEQEIKKVVHSSLAALAIPSGQWIAVGDRAVYYVEHWLPDPEAWFEELDKLPWSPERVKMYGKDVTCARETIHYGDPYDFNPLSKAPLPWDGPVDRLRRLLDAAIGRSFTQCAMNYYGDGSIVINPHHDKKDPLVVVSVSFGATREMGFCDHAGKSIDQRLPLIPLAPGSLLLFDHMFNDRYKHGIKADRSITEPRISATFRAFATAGL
jgi:alkylated DNA repair dioxygenase AlkB